MTNVWSFNSFQYKDSLCDLLFDEKHSTNRRAAPRFPLLSLVVLIVIDSLPFIEIGVSFDKPVLEYKMSSETEAETPFELVRTKRYQRKKYLSGTNSLTGTPFDNFQPKHMLLVTILLAFLGGYLLGKQDSTPSALNKALHMFGKEPEKSMNQILGDLTKIRFQLERDFRLDYGEFYGKLFDPIQMDHIFAASPMSRDRFKRRLMQKILEKVTSPSGSSPPQFVWATAGDSSAAGHGNMFNQTYSSILEKTVRPIFDQLGIEFVSRNYGMGWYNSAPELAFCMEAVYGADVDMLVWDFAMQDGHRHIHKTDLWIDRALTHPNLPLMLFVDQANSPRRPLLDRLERSGVGYILMDKSAVHNVRARVPSTAERPAMKNWICAGGAVEGSLPCDDPVRFNMCEQREAAGVCLGDKYKVIHGCEFSQHSYNPGWKEHLFKGRLFAHFVMDVLEDALITIDQWKHPNGQRTPIRSQTILDRLNNLLVLDYKNASLTPIPMTYTGVDSTLLSNITAPLLFRGQTICHTALLPSQARYLGITQESSMSGDHRGGFDVGINKVLMEKTDKLELAYDPSDRHRCVSAKIDHKDVFLMRSQDGWQTTVVPNTAELKAYRRQPLHGILMVCLQVCPNGRCADDYVGFGESMEHGKSKIEINVDNRLVSKIHKLDHGCHVLGHNKGIRWGPGQAGDGRYKIRMRLLARAKGGLDRYAVDYATKISSFIVM